MAGQSTCGWAADVWLARVDAKYGLQNRVDRGFYGDIDAVYPSGDPPQILHGTERQCPPRPMPVLPDRLPQHADEEKRAMKRQGRYPDVSSPVQGRADAVAVDQA